MLFAGIDLAGSDRRETGICLLDLGRNGRVYLARTDEEILDILLREKDGIRSVGVDAPLSLPKGRSSLSSSGPHYRKCDLELRRLGIKFFPITLGPMRKLTERGLRIKGMLRKVLPNAVVQEVFPGALYDIFGVPRKSPAEIIAFFSSQGLRILNLPERPTQDELDAVACAYTMYLFHRKRAVEIGDRQEGTIVIPVGKGHRKRP